MNSFARLFWLLVAASLPVAFGALLTAIQLFSSYNDMSTRVVSPDEYASKVAAATAALHVGLYVSIPLWLAWLVYLLIVQITRPK